MLATYPPDQLKFDLCEIRLAVIGMKAGGSTEIASSFIVCSRAFELR